jgi:hypothetical protein
LFIGDGSKAMPCIPGKLAVLWLPVKYRNAKQQLGKFIYKITGDNVD